jgi:hypothetical protein
MELTNAGDIYQQRILTPAAKSSRRWQTGRFEASLF